MTAVYPWRDYADPPWTDPGLSRAERREASRARRDAIGFASALADASSGFVVWMCADSLDAVDAQGSAVLDAAHVDDALPGPWEHDLLALAARVADTPKAAQALAEGYQGAVAAIASVPLHDARAQALRRSRRLGEGIAEAAAQSSRTAVRRLLAPGARLRRDRIGERWGSSAGDAPDPTPEFAQYRESLPESTAHLLAQYVVADAVADGQGRLMVLLSRGGDADDVLLLEAVPALPSSREEAFGAWREGSDVQRVLLAREAIPLVPVEFGGWSTSGDGSVARVWGRARAASGAPDLGGRRASARRLGAALGLVHAASSDAVALSGYLGRSGRFPSAVRDAVAGE